jgi:SagB-type dehydrogenase family enzyme
MAQSSEVLELPKPSLKGDSSLEQLLTQRRSIRDYSDTALSIAEVGQLLWAAQGVTHTRGFRTAPSAGALYPLELYLVTARVDGLTPGVYHYEPRRHRLEKSGDEVLDELSRSALSQSCVKQAAAVIVLAAVYERTTKKYGNRGRRYVHIEVGHVAQNIFLQSEALGLATVTVGAFDDKAVARVLRIPDDMQPLLLMPIGRK